MPNPFDLRGPEFLAFYVVLGLVATAAVATMRRALEPAGAGAGPMTDYLRIAYLRGGPDEALRVAMLALMDRGLIQETGEHEVMAASSEVPAALQRTEQRLLESCRKPIRASDLLADETLKITAAAECEPQLIRAGLLPDATINAVRLWLWMMTTIVIVAVAFVKILIALGRGRTNVGYLIVAALVFCFVIYRVSNPFRTSAGDAMLGDLRTLFHALQGRASSLTLGSANGGNDLLLLAAVFGLESLPASVGSLETLFGKRASASSSSGGSSCGSGGSCGSSCGSSCGGGGCGGGCGGCGS